jgi:hypothetical protein
MAAHRGVLIKTVRDAIQAAFATLPSDMLARHTTARP